MSGALRRTETPAIRPWFRRGPVSTLQDEMREWFGNWFGEGEFGASPALDLVEADGGVEVRVDMPGMKPEDIDIQLNDNLLTVSGRREDKKEDKGETFHRVERRWGSFSRSVTLPCGVKPDSVDAQYKDGVLTIHMQKSDEAKTRKITVKS